jgi:hypothetical protein
MRQRIAESRWQADERLRLLGEQELGITFLVRPASLVDATQTRKDYALASTLRTLYLLTSHQENDHEKEEDNASM